MHTPKLPIQFNATPAPAAAGQRASGGGDAQFSATLSREVNQRQQKTAMPAPAPAKSAPPVKAEQARPADKAVAAKPADEAAPPAKDAGAPAKDAATDSADAQAAAAAEAAAAGGPALDMLALVASLNLPGAAAPATPAPAAPAMATDLTVQAAAAAGAVPGELANMMGKLDGKELDVAAPLATDGGSPIGKAVERLVADDAPLQARPDPATGQPKGLSDASQFAALLPRDAAREAKPEPAALKDLAVAAPAAPTTAPLQQASLALAQAATGVQHDKIAARVGTPGWDQQVGQKIVWMVAGQEQSASLTLNPPDMGPMQVVLSVTNDQATVTFSAAQPEVRQALEDAMPKLREMMNESGIALGNASVNDGSAQQQAQAEARLAGRGGREGGGQGGSAHEGVVAPAPRRGGEQLGLVDTFA